MFVDCMGCFRTSAHSYRTLRSWLSPISRLLRGDGTRVWTLRHDAIVRRVLHELTLHAGLRLPQSRKPFVLEVSASDEGYGGVLL